MAVFKSKEQIENPRPLEGASCIVNPSVDTPEAVDDRSLKKLVPTIPADIELLFYCPVRMIHSNNDSVSLMTFIGMDVNEMSKCSYVSRVNLSLMALHSAQITIPHQVNQSPRSHHLDPPVRDFAGSDLRSEIRVDE